MGIRCERESGGKRLSIRVQGRFDFAQQRVFRETYRDVQDQGVEYVVDLSGASYIDSAALGMLLLLREHAEEHGGRVQIQNCNPDVRRVLEIANFQRLFLMS